MWPTRATGTRLPIGREPGIVVAKDSMFNFSIDIVFRALAVPLLMLPRNYQQLIPTLA